MRSIVGELLVRRAAGAVDGAEHVLMPDKQHLQDNGQEIHRGDNPGHDSPWTQEVQRVPRDRRHQRKDTFSKVKRIGKGRPD